MKFGILLIPIAVTLGGCFLASWSPDRPDGRSVSGPPVYREQCQSCHGSTVGRQYEHSAHAAKGLPCGQCHAAAGHPDFARPVRDTTCAGCHQAEYQQTVASTHFTARVQRSSVDADRAARAALRREGFIVDTAGGRRFVEGRLCAACHYDEHRLGLGAVQRQDFCGACHGGRDEHYPMPTPAGTNRCVECHVRVGETVTGQVVHTHRFSRPGVEDSGR